MIRAAFIVNYTLIMVSVEVEYVQYLILMPQSLN